MKVNQERAIRILARLTMDTRVLQKKLADLQRNIVQDKNQLLATNVNWKPQSDMRALSLNHFAAVALRTGLGIEFLGELLDDDWWESHLSEALPDDAKNSMAESFERIVKYNFGMDFFTGIESSFRAFLRALDPSACDAGTGPFNNVYTCLLGSRQLAFSASERDQAIELLDFVRLIRNLIHNSGVYFSDDGSDRQMTYREREYEFRHGVPVDFVTWDLLLALGHDLHQLLLKVVTHPDILAIPEIQDPFGARREVAG
jgi:hypothetical protein